jgi:RimJ/RimL family protein N-acetyltransferase
VLDKAAARLEDRAPRPAPIITPRLTLAPLTVDRAAQLLAYRSIPEISRFQSFEPRSLNDARRFIESGMAEYPAWYQLGIQPKEGGRLLGDVGFRILPEEPRQAEIGITVAPDHQRRGIGAETVRGVLGYLFGSLSVHRAFASIDPRNTASLRLFESLGMRREAHFRESLWFKGEWTDDVVFAMLRSEWSGQ